MIEKIFYVVSILSKTHYDEKYEWTYLGTDWEYSGYPCLTNLQRCERFESAKEAVKYWEENHKCLFLSVGKNNIVMDSLAVRKVIITTAFETVVPLDETYKSRKKRLESNFKKE